MRNLSTHFIGGNNGGGKTMLLEGSSQPCGCDPGCGAGHTCEQHRTLEPTTEDLMRDTVPAFQQDSPTPSRIVGEAMRQVAAKYHQSFSAIKDSGERLEFKSGSLRDTDKGKIKWSRITFGPMMRRWAQHLTTAEAKYPDPTPGFPNFMLIATEGERVRYRESAFRHFMSWFNGEKDEDHAAAVFFNINGVEIIDQKRAR